jgi:hypothetical protein
VLVSGNVGLFCWNIVPVGGDIGLIWHGALHACGLQRKSNMNESCQIWMSHVT